MALREKSIWCYLYRSYGVQVGQLCCFSTRRGVRVEGLSTPSTEGVGVGQSGRGDEKSNWKWFGIPWTLGVACLAALQFIRTLRRERRLNADGDPVTWQVCIFPLSGYRDLDTQDCKITSPWSVPGLFMYWYNNFLQC